MSKLREPLYYTDDYYEHTWLHPDIQFGVGANTYESPYDIRDNAYEWQKDLNKDKYWNHVNPGEFDVERTAGPVLRNPEGVRYRDIDVVKAIAQAYNTDEATALQMINKANKARRSDGYLADVPKSVKWSSDPNIFNKLLRQQQGIIDLLHSRNWTSLGDWYDLLTQNYIKNVNDADVPAIQELMRLREKNSLRDAENHRNRELQREDRSIEEYPDLAFLYNENKLRINKEFDLAKRFHGSPGTYITLPWNGKKLPAVLGNNFTMLDDLLDTSNNNATILSAIEDNIGPMSPPFGVGDDYYTDDNPEKLYRNTYRTDPGDVDSSLLRTVNGISNPSTNVDARHLITRNSLAGHELTHAISVPKRKKISDVIASTEPPKTSFVHGLTDTFLTGKGYYDMLLRGGGADTYGAYTPWEATLSSTQGKRIAATLYQRANGRLPQNDLEWRLAYTELANTNKPISYEHARFINYMAPAEEVVTPGFSEMKHVPFNKFGLPSMQLMRNGDFSIKHPSKQDLQKMQSDIMRDRYKQNVLKWAEKMMLKNKAGYSLNDALVRNSNNSDFSKMASVNSALIDYVNNRAAIYTIP